MVSVRPAMELRTGALVNLVAPGKEQTYGRGHKKKLQFFVPVAVAKGDPEDASGGERIRLAGQSRPGRVTSRLIDPLDPREALGAIRAAREKEGAKLS